MKRCPDLNAQGVQGESREAVSRPDRRGGWIKSLMLGLAVWTIGEHAAQAAGPRGYDYGWWSYAVSAPKVLGWRFAADLHDLGGTMESALQASQVIDVPVLVGDDRQRLSLAIARPLSPVLFSGERKQAARLADGVLSAYRVSQMAGSEGGLRAQFEFARELGIETILTDGAPSNLGLVGALAQAYGVNVAICGSHGDVAAALDRAAVRQDPSYDYTAADKGVLKPRLGACVSNRDLPDRKAADQAVARLKDRIMIVELYPVTSAAGCDAACLLNALYAGDVRPSLIVLHGQASGGAAQVQNEVAALEPVLRPIIATEALRVSKGQGWAATGESSPGQADGFTPGNSVRWDPVTAERKAAIDQALPSRALAKPARPRRLLVLTLNLAYPGHSSIPTHNYAIGALGSRTGAFTAVFDNDLDQLTYPRIKQYDAILLNNTVGMIFADPEVREGLLRFVREGGGLAALHASSHASLDWDEFHEMLGAAGGEHYDPTERAHLKLDDPGSPLNAAFGGKAFVYQDEFFRFGPPYARSKQHVLLSIDTARTDMAQIPDAMRAAIVPPRRRNPSEPTTLGRDDDDYAVSWIKTYGQGRIFYTTMGHNPTLFMDKMVASHFAAGLQYVLGDLSAGAGPSR